MTRRVIYLACATRFAETIALPVLTSRQADFFDRAIILRGVRNSNAPSEADRYNAVTPALRLKNLIAHRFDNFEILDADPHDLRACARAIYGALARCASGDVIANMTGGTKVQNFAMLQALRFWMEADQGNGGDAETEADDKSFAAIYLTVDGERMHVIDDRGTRHWQAAPGDKSAFDWDKGMSLDQFLMLRGYKLEQHTEIPDPSQSPAQFAQDFAGNLAEAIWKAVGAAKPVETDRVIGNLNAAADRARRQEEKNGLTLKRADRDSGAGLADAVLELIAKAPAPLFAHADTATGSISFADQKAGEAIAFLNGGWLEIALARQLRRRLPSSVKVYAGANLKVLEDSTLQPIGEPVRELDVVAFDGRRLYTIEVKTGHAAESKRHDEVHDRGAINQTSLNKAKTVASEICGPFGFNALASLRQPLTPQAEKMVEDQVRHAAPGRVRICVGPQEINACLDHVVENLAEADQGLTG